MGAAPEWSEIVSLFAPLQSCSQEPGALFALSGGDNEVGNGF